MDDGLDCGYAQRMAGCRTANRMGGVFPSFVTNRLIPPSSVRTKFDFDIY